MKRLIKRWLGIDDLYNHVQEIAIEVEFIAKDVVRLQNKDVNRKFDLGDRVGEEGSAFSGVVVGFNNSNPPYSYTVTYEDGLCETYNEHELTKQDNE